MRESSLSRRERIPIDPGLEVEIRSAKTEKVIVLCASVCVDISI
jgi:hypothetical protein